MKNTFSCLLVLTTAIITTPITSAADVNNGVTVNVSISENFPDTPNALLGGSTSYTNFEGKNITLENYQPYSYPQKTPYITTSSCFATVKNVMPESKMSISCYGNTVPISASFKVNSNLNQSYAFYCNRIVKGGPTLSSYAVCKSINN